MAKDALTLSSFASALNDDADDVDAFAKLLPDSVDSLPKELLLRCVEDKALRCLAALLKKYPDYPVNETTRKEKATALHLAAAFCPQETCRYIITCTGSDDSDGCYTFTGFVAGKMIDALLDAGADGTKKDVDGNTPLDLFRKLRAMSNWEQMLQTESTFMGIIPNTYQDKHVKIKEDIERIHRVLMEAAERRENKKPGPEKENPKRKPPAAPGSSAKKAKKSK